MTPRKVERQKVNGEVLRKARSLPWEQNFTHSQDSLAEALHVERKIIMEAENHGLLHPRYYKEICDELNLLEVEFVLERESQKRKICFIDDDPDFEISLFEKVFGDVFDLLTGASFGDCLETIADGWTPDLFVLDLYFPRGEPDEKEIVALEQEKFQLPKDRGEIRQAYINYLSSMRRLRRVLEAHKQTSAGGIELAQRVYHLYPHIPIAFYSRKATAFDIVKCMQLEHVYDVIIKPSTEDESKIEAETFRKKKDLINHIEKVLKMDKEMMKRRAEMYRAVESNDEFRGLYLRMKLEEGPNRS